MNILKGKLDRKEMSRFVGVESREVDKSLTRLSDLGYIKYRKIKGGEYRFTLYPEPMNEIKFNQWPVKRP